LRLALFTLNGIELDFVALFQRFISFYLNVECPA